MTTLIDHLSTQVTTTCLCWTITRADGFILRLTEHDRPLQVAEETYACGAALTGSRFTQTAGMNPSSAAASGALAADAINDNDLAAGLWDGAQISVIRVNWRDTAQWSHVWAGYFSEVSQTGQGFEAQLVSLKADLERPVGRIYTRACDAVFGDERCGLDISAAAYAGRTCDRLFATCVGFDNVANFRGFPHMPGNDFILAGPSANSNDGGKRT